MDKLNVDNTKNSGNHVGLKQGSSSLEQFKYYVSTVPWENKPLFFLIRGRKGGGGGLDDLTQACQFLTTIKLKFRCFFFYF